MNTSRNKKRSEQVLRKEMRHTDEDERKQKWREERKKGEVRSIWREVKAVNIKGKTENR